MNWKLAVIAIAVFLSACTDKGADDKKAADSGIKALEENLKRQVMSQPDFRYALEENKAKWVRVAPGNKPWCTKLTNNVFDAGYVWCMNGYEAQIEKLSNGTVRILQIENPATR
ncbi:MAG: hypothetical protein V4607_12985 [Pseudomonadota bacterium]